jgi:hypothetical protein
MDNEYAVDYDEIRRTIGRADVIIFRFVTVPMRLLVDNRSSETDPPMVKLVPRAASTEDRFKNLKMLRPRFKLPPKISAIWWPRYISGMREQGIMDAVQERIANAGFSDVAAQCGPIYDELRRLEREELANAIGGEGYRTLWPVAR